MPTVPRVDGSSVALGAAPNIYQTTPQALGADGMEKAQQLGQVSQAASAVGGYFREQQTLADQVRVDDAINQAKEKQIDLTFGKDKGFTYQKGINALQRDSGKPLSDEYSQEYQKSVNDIAAGLGNERQKRAFMMQANNMVTGFRSSVMQHEGQEFQNYTVSVREGTIENRKREIGLYYNDPTKVDEALGSIQAAVTDLGRQFGGKSAEWIEARARKETSNALVVALNAALERNDIGYADGFLKKYGDRMDADDLLRVRGAIDKQVDSSVALKTATDTVQSFKSRMQPSSIDRVMNITGEIDPAKVVAVTMHSESGGKRYGKDGQLLTSPAGAKGEMQVMDATMRDPGFGVTPAKDDSPEERARVGRDMLGAMVKRYEGDLGKTWAAYNAGPGRLDEAVKKYGPDWLQHMPAETQAYVQKNLAAYSGEGVTAQQAGYPKLPTLEEIHAQVRAQVGDAKPARLKLALDEATRQFEDMQKAHKQQGENATAEAQRWLTANGGRVSMMPASLRESVLQFAPKEMDNLLQFGQRVAKGDDMTVPEWYQKFSDQNFLRSLSDDQFFTLSSRYLSESDRKKFAGERGALLTGANANKPSDLNGSAIKSVLDMRLRELRIDPTPKDDGGADAARVGAIRHYVDRSIMQAQIAAGKQFTDADITKHIDTLFTQTDKVDTWLGMSDKSAPMLTMNAGDIPSAVRGKLKQDFKAAGIEDPTDAQILGAYWTAKTAQVQRKKITPLSSLPDTARRKSGTVTNE